MFGYTDLYLWLAFGETAMARELTLSLDGEEFNVLINKVSREKLYGEVEVEAFDEKGNPAELLTLSADGNTFIDVGGTALATVTVEGTSIPRTELTATDIHGEKLSEVPSSFGQTNVLKEATVEEYLSQVVKSVYVLEPAEGFDLKLLKSQFPKKIFKFDFSYRGGLEYDSAFVLGNKTDAFLIVGKQGEFEFVKLNQAVTLESTEEDISGDDLDFDLL